MRPLRGRINQKKYVFYKHKIPLRFKKRPPSGSKPIYDIRYFTGPETGCPHWNTTWCVDLEGQSGIFCYGEIKPLDGLKIEDQIKKGQIIGREGRNIRAIEAATGCELVVDDTPEAIIISGFDPIRREIARLSLQRLVADGRIHPARIEEVVLKTQKQLEDHIVEIGERTILDLNIQGMHPELVRYVGRMRFRSSYGQNLLMHSRETANLCATMAAELGLNPKLAKRFKNFFLR
jgi:hypothetical protein